MNPDADAAADAADEQPQIVVDDPEDFAKTRQLRSIFDARDDYVDARRQANEQRENGDVAFQTKNRRIFRHAQDFAMAVEPLVRQHEPHFWESKVYTLEGWARADSVPSFRVALEHCKEHLPELHQSWRDLKEKQQQQQQQAFQTPSRRERKNMKTQIRWAVTDDSVAFSGAQEIVSGTPKLCYMTNRQGIKESAPPQQLSDELFRDIQKFIDDIGLGFDLEETQQTKIDNELLEEVDEWRRQNV